MACDPNTLIEQAKCYQCNLSPGMFAAVEIVLLCAWRDGTPLSCDPNTLVAQASCILGCIPPGMMPAVKIAMLCQILEGSSVFPGKGTSLINYWDLNEVSGSRANSVGTVAFTESGTVESASGKRNLAANGNNENDFLISASAITTNTPLTYAFWMKANTTAPSIDFVLDNGDIEFQYDSAGNVRFRGPGCAIDLPLGALGTFHLIVLTVDESFVYRASIDNSAFTADPGTAPASSNTFVMFGGGFDGLIDEFAHWNVALTQDDVTTLWNGGNGVFFDS